MQGEVAIVGEGGQDFAVLAVKSHVLQSVAAREQMLAAGQRWFGIRTALLAEDSHTCGPDDLVRWLARVSPAQLPWRQFTV
jgi:hypothetical protein